MLQISFRVKKFINDRFHLLLNFCWVHDVTLFYKSLSSTNHRLLHYLIHLTKQYQHESLKIVLSHNIVPFVFIVLHCKSKINNILFFTKFSNDCTQINSSFVLNIYTRIVPWGLVNLERFISRWINRFKSEIMKATAARTITPFIIRVFFGFVEELSHIRLSFKCKSFLSENIQICISSI